MKSHVAFVDDVLMSREFRTGDFVRRANTRNLLLTPFVGRVIYSNTNTGVVMVQWPYGPVLEPPTELVKVGSIDFIPPLELDQTYSTYERSLYSGNAKKEKEYSKWRKSLASSIVSEFESNTMPVYKMACEAMGSGLSEVECFTKVSSELGSQYGFDVVKRTVSNLYNQGRRLALYWRASERKYKASKREVASGSYICPKCHSAMKKTRFSHRQDLKQCYDCGFAILNADIL